jgi:hypothetical protein
MKYVIGFSIACIFWVILLYNTDMPSYKVYDCGMAEWHPDIPLEVKEECRKRRYEQYKKENANTI